MSDNIRYEVHFLAMSLATGAGLMAVYDCLRVFRMFFPHNFFFMGLEDFIYWIYCAFATFLLLYEQNDGALRAYAIGGTFLGMCACQGLVGRKLLKYLKRGQKYLKMKRKKRQRREKDEKRQTIKKEEA